MSSVTSLLIAGLPGKMALETAMLVESDECLEIATGITSPARHGQTCQVGDREITLVGADRRDEIGQSELSQGELRWPTGMMAIDYSTPDSAVANAAWYAEQGIPFVMGTTGYDAEAVKAILSQSKISAVVAPNMAAPIVMMQAAMRWLATEFPGACAESELAIRESHQQGKRDTSGTAKALVASFQELGVDYSVDQIDKVRDPERQTTEVGVPTEHLAGHAFHRYDLACADGTVNLALEHNVVGRRVYAEGTLLAVRFLATRLKAGSQGELFSMEDVLRG